MNIQAWLANTLMTSIAVIALGVGNAAADDMPERWSAFYKDDRQERFADVKSARHAGTTLRMWELANFTVPQGAAASEVVLHEYDCEAYQWRVLALRTHTQKFGRGATLVSSDTPNAQWLPIPRRSIAESTKNVFCYNIKKSR